MPLEVMETTNGAEQLQLPADLAAIAASADAQLAAGEVLPGAAPEIPEPSEHTAIAGFLAMIAGVASMAVPPIGQAYTPEACSAIATEYLRCAERYGWTFHKSASSPVVGLVAACAMPVAMNLPAFMAWNEQRKAAAAEAPSSSTSSSTSPLPSIDHQADARPHAGTRL